MSPLNQWGFFIFSDYYNTLNIHDQVNNHIDMKYKDLSYREENIGQQFLYLQHLKNISIPKNQSVLVLHQYRKSEYFQSSCSVSLYDK